MWEILVKTEEKAFWDPENHWFNNKCLQAA